AHARSAHGRGARRGRLLPRRDRGVGSRRRGRDSLQLKGLRRSQEAERMRAHVGDRIVVESEKVAQAPRSGVVEEVLQEDPPRLRVRWDDGRETVLAPAAGASRILPKRKTRAKA